VAWVSYSVQAVGLQCKTTTRFLGHHTLNGVAWRSYSVQAVELLYPRFSFLGHLTLNGVAWRSYSIQAVGLQCGLGELQHSGCRTAMQGSCSLLGHHTLNGAAWVSYSIQAVGLQCKAPARSWDTTP
jgi:hypothetical protein